jgi:hypothetical protein
LPPAAGVVVVVEIIVTVKDKLDINLVAVLAVVTDKIKAATAVEPAVVEEANLVVQAEPLTAVIPAAIAEVMAQTLAHFHLIYLLVMVAKLPDPVVTVMLP